jgi:hypothetical protein
MKKILLIIYLLPIFGLSQNYLISKYEKLDFDNKFDEYYKMFEIESKDNLILKIDLHKYVVVNENEGFKISVIESENLIINKQKLTSGELKYSNKMLDSLKKINPFKFNVAKKEDGTEMIVSDCNEIQIEAYKGNCKMIFNSYCPQDYIKEKFPYFEERLLLLNTYNYFHSLFYDKDLEKIKNADTIYLDFNLRNVVLDKLQFEKTSSKNLNHFKFKFSDKSKLIFNSLIKDESDFEVDKKDFNQKENIVTISINTINKYRHDIIRRVLSDKKYVYLIRNKSVFSRKIKFKRIFL